MTLGKLIGELAVWEDMPEEEKIVVVWAQDKDIWNLVEVKNLKAHQLRCQPKAVSLAGLIRMLLELSENSDQQPVCVVHKGKGNDWDKDIWNFTEFLSLETVLSEFRDDETEKVVNF